MPSINTLPKGISGHNIDDGLQTHTDNKNPTHTEQHKKHEINLPKNLSTSFLLLENVERSHSKIVASVIICVIPYMANDQITVCNKNNPIIY